MTKRERILGLLVVGGVAACSTAPGARGADEPPASTSARVTATSIEAAFTAAHFAVDEGRMAAFDTSNCCGEGQGCYMSNASSPYMYWTVPPGPGQTAPDPQPNGATLAFRLRGDDAVVFYGRTPPQSRYYGYTPYVFDRASNGKRTTIFASQSESLNDQVVAAPGASSPFDQQIAIIYTADRNAEQRAREALVIAGVPSDAINVLYFDPREFDVGLDATADTFAVLLRMAGVADGAARESYLHANDAIVFRATPDAQGPIVAEPHPPSRPKDHANTEDGLAAAVDQLEQGILAKYAGLSWSKSVMNDRLPDPERCNRFDLDCLGDSRDTVYPSTTPFPFLANDDDFLIVYGVNHATTKKAAYSNFVLEALEHQIGVAGVTDDQFGASAAAYTSTSVDQLYAWKIARRCNGESYCLEVPAEGGCPKAVAPGASVVLAARVYLEPSTSTAPALGTLVLDRVLAFRMK